MEHGRPASIGRPRDLVPVLSYHADRGTRRSVGWSIASLTLGGIFAAFMIAAVGYCSLYRSVGQPHQPFLSYLAAGLILFALPAVVVGITGLPSSRGYRYACVALRLVAISPAASAVIFLLAELSQKRFAHGTLAAGLGVPFVNWLVAWPLHVYLMRRFPPLAGKANESPRPVPPSGSAA